MDKRQALELCIALWQEVPDSHMEKREICRNLTNREMAGNCPACQYTKDITDSSKIECDYCPIKEWNARERGIRFACEEDEDSPYLIWFGLSPFTNNSQEYRDQAHRIIQLAEESLADEDWMNDEMANETPKKRVRLLRIGELVYYADSVELLGTNPPNTLQKISIADDYPYMASGKSWKYARRVSNVTIFGPGGAVVNGRTKLNPSVETSPGELDFAIDAIREYAEALRSGELDGAGRYPPENLDDLADDLEGANSGCG